MRRVTEAEATRRAAMGQRIAAALAAAGLGQREVARQLGISQPQVSKMVRGLLPADAYAERIAKLAGVQVRYLESGAGALPNPPPQARRGRTSLAGTGRHVADLAEVVDLLKAGQVIAVRVAPALAQRLVRQYVEPVVRRRGVPAGVVYVIAAAVR